MKRLVVLIQSNGPNCIDRTIDGLPFFIDERGKPGRVQHTELDSEQFRRYSAYLDQYAFLCELVKENGILYTIEYILRESEEQLCHAKQ